MTDYLLNALATLLVTIDPIGLAPIFLALTRGADKSIRNDIAVRACGIASLILILFILAGSAVLGFLGISLAAFRIAGGLLLFWIAAEMVFEKREKRKKETAQNVVTHKMSGADESQILDDLHQVAVFPLAIPLIAGPGAISASILLAAKAPSTLGLIALIALTLAIVASCLVVFLAAERMDRILGETGRSVLTRLLGVLLAAMSVQFVADGVKAIAAGS
ncbi:inner membrane protein [Hartmannibacter diazotrophicus]|uniref:UPF0056 membrane protein n=1 Tax=Hartmannibacter diazotrophicus TaxID=1482074 RepID=A0A2C9D5P0_9HYPH|nr:MarC family protein [Hartmannibacter diazotrophicus]SON55563.1 inner membrane protein [Hartmannibacter diazotrophicus]